jgi:superfamily II DNA helicase RecQ
LVPVNDIKLGSNVNDKSKAGTEDEKKEYELLKYLINVRNDMANEIGMSAQKVCNNTQLSFLAKLRPSSKQSLQRIEGFPYEKIETIGAQFIEKVVFFCNKFKMHMDVFDDRDRSTTSSTESVQVIRIFF